MARIFKPKQKPLPQPCNLVIDKLGGDGDGIAYWRNKTVFVSGGLPGETVTARFTGQVKGNLKAVTQAVVGPSEHRVTPACPDYGHCGGCDFMHVSPEQQVLWKQQVVLQSLGVNAGLQPARIEPAIVGDHAGYRSRARLALWRRGKRWTMGYRARAEKKVVAINSCLVLTAPLRALLPALGQWLEGVASERQLGHLELIECDQKVAIVLRLNDQLSQLETTGLVELGVLHHADIWLQTGPESIQPLAGDKPVLHRYHLPLSNLTMDFSVEDFTQINRAVNTQMVAQALHWLVDSSASGRLGRVVDLYCGIGNFTLPLAQVAQSVIGVELFPEMVERGRDNAVKNGIKNASFAGADLSDSIQVKKLALHDVDAVLLDPPRAGAREVMEPLVQHQVPRLLYVSCNPQTLVRDAALLARSGYQLDRFCVLDMFPQTKHIESMALFIKPGKAGRGG